jgi:sugar/nucleoside kinase (ribokinase family)
MDGEYTRGSLRPEVVVVGSAARDLTGDDARGWRLGGGVTYSALATGRLGIPTGAVIGVDGPAAQAREIDMIRDAGVDVRLVALARSPVFENVELPAGRVQHCAEPGDPVPVSALPPTWRDSPAWILAPVADELPAGWGSAPPADAAVAMGWQGILRDLPHGGRVERRAPARSALLDAATFVGVSRHDVDPGTTIGQLLDFLAPTATLVVTRGDDGGVLVQRDGPDRIAERVYAAIPPATILDPTGAGDVFLATLLCGLTFPDRLERAPGLDGAIRLAAAAASLVVEGPGLDAVPWRADVLRRADALETPA